MSAVLYPAVATFKERVLRGEQVTGLFCQLGSPAAVEIASRAGFDFVLLDQEHGLGGEDVTLAQLTAAAGAPSCVPLVRIASNETPRFKRALDLGACGIMVPCVEDAASAVAAVRAMRYTPGGERGLAKTTRATAYGSDFETYFATADARLLVLLQIETVKGVANVASIAGVEGVDVLFVGPTDLGASIAGGAPVGYDDPRLVAARRAVVAAARAAGKAAGILCMLPEHVRVVRDEGFTLVMLGSDLGAAATGIRGFAAALRVPHS